MKIAVIGGGIVGMTTSLELRKEFRTSDITVFASSFNDTTSHVAAGLFRVGNSFSGPSEDVTRQWVRDSYEYYNNIRKSSEAAIAGVAEISGYMFAKNNSNSSQNHWQLPGGIPLYRKANKDELDLVGNEWKYGVYFTTLLTECTLHLPWTMLKLQEQGVNFVGRKINTLKELSPRFDLIINCSGMGARNLCNDKFLVPIRGQVAKMKAPWIKTCFYGDVDTYIIPGFNGICTLGGVRSFESESQDICPYESAAIRERCNKLVPSLARGETLRHLTGIRPYRGIVRVEPDVLPIYEKTKVVHNYGHGGYGVSTAPGTSKYAVELAKELHRSTSKL